MGMTAGKLRSQLEGLADDAAIMMLFEGDVIYAENFVVAPTGQFAILRGKDARHGKRFSVAEDGLIGGLTSMGVSDAAIADFVNRSPDSIKKRKKEIGLG